MLDSKPEVTTLNAGRFSDWLTEIIGSLEGKNDSKVPCGDCVGCCTSGYFVHIKPTDMTTFDHVPAEIMFPAPGLPNGNFLLGYDEQGFCPMFKQGKCSIYDFRPETCRQYDCRIFPATGLSINSSDKPRIAKQINSWKFNISSPAEQESLDATKSAAKFILEYKDKFPNDFIPANTLQQAVLAIRIYSHFKGLDDSDIPNKSTQLIKTITERYATM